MAEWFRALALKSGGPGFKAPTLPPAGFLTMLRSIEIFVFCFSGKPVNELSSVLHS